MYLCNVLITKSSQWTNVGTTVEDGRLAPGFLYAMALSGGAEDRDVAFMERLRCLAREALSWAWLTPQPTAGVGRGHRAGCRAFAGAFWHR